MSLLLDTGGLVTLLDRAQRHHDAFATFFDGWRGAVVSSEAVLTEASHLLGRTAGGRVACLDFFLSGGATLVPQSRATVARCRDLIERYADVPMDFADATLVVLAEDLDTDLILTTDRRDFSIYRINGRRRFKVVPLPER
jgi:predicted nucleic acid-binding protein